MPSSDNKVMSISFDNKQFLRDVADTIEAIEELNEATSGKKINTSGFTALKDTFRALTKGITDDASNVSKAIQGISDASDITFKTSGIDSLRKALENTGMTAVDVEDSIATLQQISQTGIRDLGDLGASSTAQQIQDASTETRTHITQDVDDVTEKFKMLEYIGIGAMIAIGDKAIDLGQNALSYLTRGIRDGWGEYNSLVNSTQTILTNTERWGTTMDDVSGALSELNSYADLTTYAFSDMTRNIGYFTTAGINLEDSVTAIKGLSNVGALFGADAQSVARAGYQISQAMSAGVIKLMDWRSLVNAGMGGKVLQDELIRTAAVMSGESVDSMNEYIESLGGFNQSLQTGWLTADIFLEAMKTFAGQTREYYEQLTDENGNRLYTDEEIDQLVKLGEAAMESATKVRTFRQMMDAFGESIGSGWQQTFSLIIGNLEESYEFWTPINDILSGLVNKFFELQTGSLELWRSLGGRENLLEGINNILRSISDVLGAIGQGFMSAFGGNWRIGSRLAGITEMVTDFTEHLILSEEELGYLKDFFSGLFEPISLIVDVLFEFARALFNAGDGASEMETTADSVYSGIGQFRKALLQVLGYIGSILKAGGDFIRENKIVRKVITSFVKIVTKLFSGLVKVISAPFYLLYQVWERYDIGSKLEELGTKVAMFFLPLIDAVNEAKDVFESWFNAFTSRMGSLLDSVGGPLAVLEEVFGALKQLFSDIFDPTISLSDAFGTFIDTVSGGKLGELLRGVKEEFLELWDAFKQTAIGQWFEDLGTKIQNAWNVFSQTPVGQWINDIITSIEDFLGLDSEEWSDFWSDTAELLGTVASTISSSWEKIKSFFSELVSTFKEWFGLSDSAQETVSDASEGITGAVGDGFFSGQIARMPEAAGFIATALLDVAQAAETAEKAVPDPKDSKFLEFLRAIPETFNDVITTISNSKVIKNIREFFSLLGGSISSFFSQDLNGQKEDIIDFFTGIVGKVEELIGSLLGIEDFKFGEFGVFETIGLVISSFLNTFGNIDDKAMLRIGEIAGIVVIVMNKIIAIKMATTVATFARGVMEAGKAWKFAQKAANNLAAAANKQAMASLLIAFAAVLFSVLAIVVFVASYVKTFGWKNIAIAFAGIIIIIGALFYGLQQLANAMKSKNFKPTAFAGIARMLSSIGTMLLSLLVFIAGIGAIVVLFTQVIAHVQAKGWQDEFLAAIGAVVVLLFFLGVGITGLVLMAYFVANSTKETQGALKAFSNILDDISGLLISVVIFIGGIIAAIVLLTQVIAHVEAKGRQDEFLKAIIMVGVLLVAVSIGVGFLLKYAKSMATSLDADPKDFRKNIMAISGLIAIVTLGVAVMLAAVVGLVYAMDGVENGISKFIAAAAIVAVLMVAMFFGLYLIMTSFAKVANHKPSKIITAIIAVSTILGIIGLGVYLIVSQATSIADQGTNLGTLALALLAIGATLAAVIIAIGVVTSMISKLDLEKVNNDRMEAFAKLAGGVLLGLTAIAVIFMGLMAVAGYFNVDWTTMAAITLSMIAMVGLVAFLVFGTLALVKNGAITPETIKPLMDVAKALLLVSSVFIIIGIALAMVTVVASNPSFVAGAVALGALFLVLSAAIGIISAFNKDSGKTVLAVAGAIAIASLAFLAIAGAFALIATIDTTTILVAAGVMLLLTVAMGVLLGVLAGLGSTGAGLAGVAIAAVAILALGTAFVMLGGSIMIAGRGIQIGAEGVMTFVDAMERLESLDTDAISSRVGSLGESLVSFTEDLAAAAVNIGTVFYHIAMGIVGGIFKGIVTGIRIGSVAVLQMIIANAPLFGNAIRAVGTELVLAVHDIIVTITDVIIEDFGPNGRVRPALEGLMDFVEWFAGKVTGWGMDIMESFLDGAIEAIGDENKIRLILTKAELLILTISEGILDFLGIPNFTALGATIMYDILSGLVSMAQDFLSDSTIGQAIASILEEFDIDVDGILSEMESDFELASDIAAGDLGDHFGTTIENLRNDIAEMERLGNTASSAYNPTDYYRGISGAAQEATESSDGFLSSITGLFSSGLPSLSSLFGDFSLSDILGHSGGGGGRLGEIGDSLSGITGNLGSITSMLGGEGGFDISSIFNSDVLSNFSGGLGGIMDIFGSDGFQNPVISPTVDTTGVELGIADIESMFNNSNIGEFAIDAGNSMLIGDRTDGDASSDGSVVNNYTQIINGESPLSEIQLYRDTRSLLRGSFS